MFEGMAIEWVTEESLFNSVGERVFYVRMLLEYLGYRGTICP